jgi:hypothetical protein
LKETPVSLLEIVGEADDGSGEVGQLFHRRGRHAAAS